MKYCRRHPFPHSHRSHPARGAWIEISRAALSRRINESHPARGAWIEIVWATEAQKWDHLSHPARGAWIEIRLGKQRMARRLVAPRTGCVD